MSLVLDASSCEAASTAGQQARGSKTHLDFELVVLVLALSSEDVARDADLHWILQAGRTWT